MWLGIPSWVISVRIVVAPWLWRLNSLFIIVVNKWNLSKFWERVWYKVHDFNMDHVSFIYGLYEDLMVERKNLVRELLRKRTLILAKALPWIPSLHSWVFSIFTSVKSCWVLLYSGFFNPCCRWTSWAGLLWTVLHDDCSNWRWQVNVWPLGRAL